MTTQSVPAIPRPNGTHTAWSRQRPAPKRDGASAARRGALALVALLSVLVLLTAFALVAQHSVRAGELRRARFKARADATWRCNVIAESRQRTACLRAIDEAPDAATGTTFATN